MKIVAINGSPRKNWNTDTLLKKVLEGANSAGAETEMVYLYDLKFRGCLSCLACKMKDSPNRGRCVVVDDLNPILAKLHDADAVVMGSPIYFSEVTGMMRCFIERFLFQYLNYDDFSKPLSPAKKIAMVYTMNIAEPMLHQFGYDVLFKRYEGWMNNFFGSCTTLLCTETMQVKDYSRYHLGAFNGDERKKRHETVFVEDCKKAYDLGIALTK